MNLVRIASYNNYIEAYIIMGRLEQENIRCHLLDEHSVTIDPFISNAIGGIKLLVAAVQANRALQILNEGERQTEDLLVITS